ncbi:hypothetical protein V6N13_078229 [Hibiscus sabdariffa]|uniref:Uncharacterized protein n=1 Tax=Hibiscus sabdariffa TaxID=183260 RepID=A0ABR2RNE6_9ROSI
MAANWVLLPFLFSLCLATSYGWRTGVPAMDDRVEKDTFPTQIGYMQNPDPDGSVDPNPDYLPPRSGITPEPVLPQSSNSHEPPSCIIPGNYGSGGCYSGACNFGCNPCSQDYGVADGLVGLNELKQTIRDLTMKLEANGLLGRKKA